MGVIKEPRVSLILPVYNGEDTIASTINSLLNQTFGDFELLICIDGSTDNSKEILNACNDQRIKIFVNKINNGLASTLNRLMMNVSESVEYIAMAEQDDWYYPYRLEKQVAFLDSNHDYGLVSGISEHWQGDDSIPSLFPDLLVNGGQYPKDFEAFFRLNYRNQVKVVNTCMMFRKSVYIENGLYFSRHFPSVSIDWSFILRFCRYAPIYGLNRVLVRMDRRKDRDSITTDLQKKNEAAFELIRFMKYEFRDFVTREDFTYAHLNQRIIMAASCANVKRLLLLCWLFVRYTGHNLVANRFLLEFKRFTKRYLRSEK